MPFNASPSMWFGQFGTSDDYFPWVFEPRGARTYAVKGQPFWLDLSVEDKKAIAFLWTI